MADTQHLRIPKPRITLKMRKRGTYDVLVADHPIGMVSGDYASGFTAYDRYGKRVGHYHGPDAKEKAAEATQTALEVEHITRALGGTILQIDVSLEPVRDVTAHVA